MWACRVQAADELLDRRPVPPVEDGCWSVPGALPDDRLGVAQGGLDGVDQRIGPGARAACTRDPGLMADACHLDPDLFGCHVPEAGGCWSRARSVACRPGRPPGSRTTSRRHHADITPRHSIRSGAGPGVIRRCGEDRLSGEARYRSGPRVIGPSSPGEEIGAQEIRTGAGPERSRCPPARVAGSLAARGSGRCRGPSGVPVPGRGGPGQPAVGAGLDPPVRNGS